STYWTQCQTSVSQELARIRHVFAVDTRGGSRMRESRTYGSVRGARGNSRPYREGQATSEFGTKLPFRDVRYPPLTGVDRTWRGPPNSVENDPTETLTCQSPSNLDPSLGGGVLAVAAS